MTSWVLSALLALVVGFTYPWLKPLLRRRVEAGVEPQQTSTTTVGEKVEKLHSVDRFFAGGDSIEWIAVRAELKTVASAWADLIQATSHRQKVAGERLAHEVRAEAHWVVYQYSRSDWTHIQFIRGCCSLSDRQLRGLSRRTASEALLLYGRNDFDKARALACIRYQGGRPGNAVLIGEDADQDLVLDYLQLDQDEISDLDFDFDFDLGRDLAAKFLAERGVEPRDASGELERVDLLIA